MQITPSIAGTFAASAISLIFFIRFLIISLTCKKQKVYFWLMLWFLGALIYGVTRFFQYALFDPHAAVINAKILNVVGFAIMPALLMAFVSEYIQEWLKPLEKLGIGMFQLCIGVLILFGSVVLGNKMEIKTSIFNENFRGLSLGILFVPVGVVVIIITVYCAVRVIKSKNLKKNDKSVMATVLALAPVLLLNDTLPGLFHVNWFRLYDYYFMMMGLAFDIGLFSNLIDVFGRNQKAIVEQSRELEASNDRVMKLAYFDELTGLPNRNKLFEWLETTVQNNVAGKLAVYLIDIRNFSNTNGYFGYEKGDEFLISIANRLNQFRSRGSILARIEGVRLVYARTISGYEDPGGLAERFIEAFQSPVETGNLSYRFDLNIGVCVYPDHGDSFRDILKNSGIALTYAKRKPNMRYEVFSSKLLEYTEKRRIMEMDLSVAIWNNELRLVYQPQYDLKRESIRGFEALLRWRSKDYGEISPGEFIPIAEEAGLIIQIGEWVIRKVAEKALEIKHKYNLGITFCINISPIQLMNKGFLALLEELAATSPDVRSLLEFEITEGIMVAYDEGIDVFNRAKELGYSLALDDFGTGYSSLSYLKRLPIDILKIDRSFIMELEEKSGNFGITDNIIDIGHKMNFEVIAEGVETEEQLNILRQCGCDYIQGYYYARPMEEVKLEGYIEDQLYDRYRVKGKETGKGAADKPMV